MVLKIPSKPRADPFNEEEKLLVMAGFEENFPHYFPYVKFLFGISCGIGEANTLQRPEDAQKKQ